MSTPKRRLTKDEREQEIEALMQDGFSRAKAEEIMAAFEFGGDVIVVEDEEREAAILKRMELHGLSRERAEHMVWIIEGGDDAVVVEDGTESPDR